MAFDPKKLKHFADSAKKNPFSKKGKPPADDEDDDDKGDDGEDEDEDEHDDSDDGDPQDEDVDVDEAAGELDDLDPKVRKLAKGYDPAKHGNPPQWVEDEDTWEKAKKAVDPEGDGADKWDEPWAVTTAVYRKMGGALKSKKSKD